MRLLLAFQQIFPDLSADWIVQAPGREMWAAAAHDQRALFTLVLADGELRTSFNFRSAKLRTTVMQRPLPLWARYPAGVIVALREQGLEMGGFQAVLAGEEPPGPRHDHALGMAVAALGYEMHRHPYTAESLFDLVEQVRRDYVDG